MKGMGEEVLREPVRSFLEARGYEVFDEIPIGGRFADVVGIHLEDVMAVELKLAQWRVALQQARAYQLGAQLSYVALPLPLALKLSGNPQPFQNDGVGLLGVSLREGEVREIVPPQFSPRFLPFLSKGVIAVARASAEGFTLPPLASLLADLWEAEA